MSKEKEGAAQDIGALRESEALFRWLSRLFDEPIAVPGTDFVAALQQTLPAAFDLSRTDSQAMEHFRAFLDSEEVARDPEAAQRALAIDRTYLLRGVDPQGLQPPYESFYSPGKDNALESITKLMADAGIRPAESNRERPDYIGNEFALAAFFCRKAAQGDEDSAEAQRRAESVLDDHLGQWVPRYAKAAYPAAKTEFFKGILCLLTELFEA